MTLRTTLAVLLCLAGCGTAGATDGVKKCDLVDLSPETGVIDFAKVAPANAKLNFIKGTEGGAACPSTAEACQKRAFVLAGDLVMMNKAPGAFVCAEFTSTKGNLTAGFLPAAALVPATPPDIPVQGWLGKWRTGQHQSLEITRAKQPGEVLVSGEATYGSDDPVRVKNGAVNQGSFSVRAKPRGMLIEIATDSTTDGAPSMTFETADKTVCKLRIQFEGDELFAQDNENCGGMNVSFDGAYKRY